MCQRHNCTQLTFHSFVFESGRPFKNTNHLHCLKILFIHARIQENEVDRWMTLSPLKSREQFTPTQDAKSSNKFTARQKALSVVQQLINWSELNFARTVSVYSIVENCGISSAGWCCSVIAAYCGGNCKDSARPTMVWHSHLQHLPEQSGIYLQIVGVHCKLLCSRVFTALTEKHLTAFRWKQKLHDQIFAR